MRFELTHGPGQAALLRFLQDNGLKGATVTETDGRVVVDVPDEPLADDALLRSALIRHFSFMDLFFWVPNGLEDVSYWDRHHRWLDVVSELNGLFPLDSYDVLASVEARGFFLAGILSYALGKPAVPVRKYREAFARFPGEAATYRNWRGHDDRLWLQELPWLTALRGSRALFVDDIMETGNSLETCARLLASAGIATVGAMYLFDVSEPGVRERFQFPIRSLLRLNDLSGNVAAKHGPSKQHGRHQV